MQPSFDLILLQTSYLWTNYLFLRSSNLKCIMDYSIKKWGLIIPLCADQAIHAGTDIFIQAITLPRLPGFFKWYVYSFFTRSLKRETQRLKWFTTMVLKWVSSWERVTEVTHRRTLKSSLVMIITLDRLQALCKQPLQITLNSCTWIYHRFQETGCTLKQSGMRCLLCQNANKTER